MAAHDDLARPPATPQLSSMVRPGILVFGWGRTDLGQLALQNETVPLPQRLLAFDDRGVTLLAGNAYNSVALTADGEVYTLGSNDRGQLGATSYQAEQAYVPIRVTALDLHRVVHVACGQNHVLAATDQGLLASWGAAEWGQLGGGTEGPDQPVPKIIKTAREGNFVRVAAGACHSVALTSAGQVYSFGQGTFGALGHGDKENRSSPVLIERLWSVGVVQVACGENHSAALAADGRVFTWGRGKYGQLGHGDFDSLSTPKEVAGLRGALGKQVACGGDHTLLLGSCGGVWSWGCGTAGQTGLGAPSHTCRPQRIQALDGRAIVQVAAGSRHSVVLTSEGDVLTFGAADSGQLGLGPQAGGHSVLSPQLVAALPNLPVLFVVAAGDHTFAVLQDMPAGGSLVDGATGISNRHGSEHPLLTGVHAATRPHGLGLMPLHLPPVGVLASEAAAADRGGTSPGHLVLCRAVDDLFSSPGYLVSGFMLPEAALEAAATPLLQLSAPGSRTPPAGLPSPASSADPPPPPQQRRAGAHHVAPHRLDLEAIGSVYHALLRLYSPEVVSALGSACIKLLSHLEALLQPWSSRSGPLADPQQQTSAGARLSSLRTPDGVAAAAGPASAAAVGVMPEEWLRALVVLFQNPLNSEASSLGTILCAKLINVVMALDSFTAGSSVAAPPAQGVRGDGGSSGGGGAQGVLARMLAAWLATLPPEVFGGRVVRPLQRYLGKLLSTGKGLPAVRTEVLLAAGVLELLHDANASLPPSAALPYTEFYSRSLSDAANLREEYLTWVQGAARRGQRQAAGLAAPTTHAPTSLCDVPFLLTPDAKSRILQGEANLQKQHEVHSNALNALLLGMNPTAAVRLDISVRRSHVLQDALAQIVARPGDLKKPLRVTFISNGVPEEGVDEGGVSREFFQLLVVDIFKPEYGMFKYNEETHTFWFNEASLESQVEFQLVGLVLGLAIYNSIILNVHLPRLTYKKLLGQAPTFPDDLAEVYPALARGLQQLLDFEGDVEATFCRTFEVEVEFYGEVRHQELIPGGANIPVTAENRRQFVEVYTRYLLTDSISNQFNAFAHGFHQVCGGPALRLFRQEELELLVCGLPHLDFKQLEKGARYEGGYHADHPMVRRFWSVLHSLDTPAKRRFLQFATGCDRAPVGGLADLTLLIQRGGPDSDRLPTTHTCFNVLLLPEYSSEERLRERLLLAMEHGQQGFGLQ